MTVTMTSDLLFVVPSIQPTPPHPHVFPTVCLAASLYRIYFDHQCSIASHLHGYY